MDIIKAATKLSLTTLWVYAWRSPKVALNSKGQVAPYGAIRSLTTFPYSKIIPPYKMLNKFKGGFTHPSIESNLP